jgi:hypothetical protein
LHIVLPLLGLEYGQPVQELLVWVKVNTASATLGALGE